MYSKYSNRKHRPTIRQLRQPHQSNAQPLRKCSSMKSIISLVIIGALFGNVMFGMSIVKSSSDTEVGHQSNGRLKGEDNKSPIGNGSDEGKGQSIVLDGAVNDNHPPVNTAIPIIPDSEDQNIGGYNSVDGSEDRNSGHGSEEKGTIHSNKKNEDPQKQANSSQHKPSNSKAKGSHPMESLQHIEDQANGAYGNEDKIVSNSHAAKDQNLASKSHKKPDGMQKASKGKSPVKITNVIPNVFKGKNMTAEELARGFKILSQQSISTALTPTIMKTARLPDHKRKRILVTGGAGFVGSHLVDKLMVEGHEVIVLDNFFTGQKKNVAHWQYHPNFSLILHDVTDSILLEVDQIYHLACPASPPHYQYNSIKTIKTSTQGTLNMLGLAKRVNARILLASTSEIYGNPLVHPQNETYWGNVNTIGPRSCYDEGKRVAETMMYAYRDQADVSVRVARIFNTFGPRMHPNDGRVVSNFIIQALQGLDLTIYGDGEQSRSFQYVADLVEGLYALMNGDYDLPVNLGNPHEWTVKEFAEHIKSVVKSESNILFLDANQDDPLQRKPDVTRAQEKLGWTPKISVDTGLNHTIQYFKNVLQVEGKIIPTGPGASKPKVWDE